MRYLDYDIWEFEGNWYILHEGNMSECMNTEEMAIEFIRITDEIDRLRQENGAWRYKYNKRLFANEKYVAELEFVLKELYESGKIAVNQIICLGGEETCQPCENRERLSVALELAETVLGIK